MLEINKDERMNSDMDSGYEWQCKRGLPELSGKV